jgi:hypothetical protein
VLAVGRPIEEDAVKGLALLIATPGSSCQYTEQRILRTNPSISGLATCKDRIYGLHYPSTPSCRHHRTVQRVSQPSEIMAVNCHRNGSIEVAVNGTRVHGLTSPLGVAKFLGIPFARVTQRFRPAQRVHLASIGPDVNATSFGPRCPQSWNHGPQSRIHLYQGVSLSSSGPVSEAECLNLNVYTPTQGLSDKSKLPVLVWIHGGGWVFGDGGSEYGESTTCGLMHSNSY